MGSIDVRNQVTLGLRARRADHALYQAVVAIRYADGRMLAIRARARYSPSDASSSPELAYNSGQSGRYLLNIARRIVYEGDKLIANLTDPAAVPAEALVYQASQPLPLVSPIYSFGSTLAGPNVVADLGMDTRPWSLHSPVIGRAS